MIPWGDRIPAFAGMTMEVVSLANLAPMGSTVFFPDIRVDYSSKDRCLSLDLNHLCLTLPGDISSWSSFERTCGNLRFLSHPSDRLS